MYSVAYNRCKMMLTDVKTMLTAVKNDRFFLKDRSIGLFYYGCNITIVFTKQNVYFFMTPTVQQTFTSFISMIKRLMWAMFLVLTVDTDFTTVKPAVVHPSTQH